MEWPDDGRNAQVRCADAPGRGVARAHDRRRACHCCQSHHPNLNAAERVHGNWAGGTAGQTV